ncbi:FKBP-type peptidyl-prolyl cis-trans isomerase [Candidatus Saccharibacteria bacterium]|nr:FKBP-type peptidyl-prolyl cis-trans isomerase [Candidatus Saccharibacteria bacterium]
MQEKDLKPSVKQRVIFALVAALLLGSSIAAYVMIVMGNNNINYSKMNMQQLQDAYSEKNAELDEVGEELSNTYFDEFKAYKKNVKAYNSSTANSNGVQSKDLKEGDGETIGDSGYAAYYIGWCSDESIFDSSFDNIKEPTALKTPIIVEEQTLIEGWYLGTEGMRLGGVREITIPGPLAYGESQEICGGTNSPLKFIIMPVPISDRLKELNSELDKIYSALINAYSQTYSNTDENYDSDEETTSGE